MRLKHFSKFESGRVISLILGLSCLVLPDLLMAGADPVPQEAATPSQEPAQIKSPEDLAREKAVAEFTQRMKDSNYPALFDKAAREFGVPTDVLQGIAFAET